MNLESAFEKHGGWIEKFCAAIFNQDTLDIATYEKDNNCELGEWLYGEAKAQYGGLNAYANLILSHAEFHKVAGKVVRAINAKDYKLAEDLLSKDGAYAEASHSVRIAILKLREETHL